MKRLMQAQEINRRVAVVDDDGSLRTALVRVVRSAGFSAEAFASGQSFVASLTDAAPDCAILDVRLPGLNGFEVLDQIRGVGWKFPVVMISAEAFPPVSVRIWAVDVFAFLQKPVRARLLLDTLAGALATTGAPPPRG
jgi:FixJ family two-component response regulator